jgi:hypothetical protein
VGSNIDRSRADRVCSAAFSAKNQQPVNRLVVLGFEFFAARKIEIPRRVGQPRRKPDRIDGGQRNGGLAAVLSLRGERLKFRSFLIFSPVQAAGTIKIQIGIVSGPVCNSD